MNRHGAVLLCAILSAALSAGCPEKPGCPDDSGYPKVDSAGTAASPEKFPKPPVDEKELAQAPDDVFSEADAFYVRVIPAPTKDSVRKKPEVVRNAARLLLGDARAKDDAARELAALGMASACFLQKTAKETARENNLDAYASEDAVMEVIFRIQDGYLRGKDMKALLRYFAAVTGKTLLVEKPVLEMNREFDVRNVYPIPALGRVGDILELDDALWQGMSMDAPVLELSTRVAYDLKIHEEDAAWTIKALARVGNVRIQMDDGMQALVTMRVRAATCEAAITQIARHAGFEVKSSTGTLVISKP